MNAKNLLFSFKKTHLLTKYGHLLSNLRQNNSRFKVSLRLIKTNINFLKTNKLNPIKIIINSLSDIHTLNSKNSLKWLTEKIDIDLKEIRVNFNYFRKHAINNPFAIIQLDPDAIKNPNLVKFI
jgi:hypothetical protein